MFVFTSLCVFLIHRHMCTRLYLTIVVMKTNSVFHPPPAPPPPTHTWETATLQSLPWRPSPRPQTANALLVISLPSNPPPFPPHPTPRPTTPLPPPGPVLCACPQICFGLPDPGSLRASLSLSGLVTDSWALGTASSQEAASPPSLRSCPLTSLQDPGGCQVPTQLTVPKHSLLFPSDPRGWESGGASISTM